MRIGILLLLPLAACTTFAPNEWNTRRARPEPDAVLYSSPVRLDGAALPYDAAVEVPAPAPPAARKGGAGAEERPAVVRGVTVLRAPGRIVRGRRVIRHRVGRPDHAVRRPSHAVRLPGHAVGLPGHAVGVPGHAVRLPDQAVPRPAHPTRRSAPPVRSPAPQRAAPAR